MKLDLKPKQQKSAVEDNVCSLCKSVGTPPPCKGHAGGGGGGGSGGGSTTSSENVNRFNNPLTTKITPVNNPVAIDWLEALRPRAGVIQFEAGLIQINSDNLNGILTLLAKKDMTEQDLKVVNSLFNAIQSEFKDFKQNLQSEGVSTDHFKCERKENGLRIQIPQPSLYEAFILHLIDKNLLPSPNVNKNSNESKQTFNNILSDELLKKRIYPNPFSTKLRRS